MEFYLILLIAFFAFVDGWYVLRALKFVAQRILLHFTTKVSKRLTMEQVLAVRSVPGIVLPSDLDWMFHMNNSKYLREMDFGRFKWYVDVIHVAMKKHKSRFGLSAISIRYRRSLLLWQRFTLETRLVCWKDDAFYLEQRFVGDKDKFVYAIALIKFLIRGKVQKMDKIFESIVGDIVTSPPVPPEVENWMKSIDKSSEGLKKERLDL